MADENRPPERRWEALLNWNRLPITKFYVIRSLSDIIQYIFFYGISFMFAVFFSILI